MGSIVFGTDSDDILDQPAAGTEIYEGVHGTGR